MKLLLDKIIRDCLAKGLKVNNDIARDGSIGYRISGFSKSGNAFLYIEDTAIICETSYGEKEHILSFRDLVHIAKDWYLRYRDTSPFENPEPEWKPVLESFFYDLKLGVEIENQDLPF